MADRVSARRTNANNFFLGMHAALATVVGLLASSTKVPSAGATGLAPDRMPILLVAGAGVLLCAAWWLGLRSYRDLNRAKFRVINEMEAQLPAKPFSAEWKFLKDDQVKSWRSRYAEQGTVERFVPFVFACLYLFGGAWAFGR